MELDPGALKRALLDDHNIATSANDSADTDGSEEPQALPRTLQTAPTSPVVPRAATFPTGLDRLRSASTSEVGPELNDSFRPLAPKRFTVASWTSGTQSWSAAPLRQTTAFMATSSEFLLPKAELHKATEERLRTYAFKAMRRRSASGGSSIFSDTEDGVLDNLLTKEWYNSGDFFMSYLVAERFYYWYLSHLVLCSIAGAVLMVVFDPTLELGDAIFAAVGSITQSGLVSVDWSKQRGSTHAISAALMLLGSVPLLSLVPVLLRRSSFRRQQAAEAIDSPVGHGAKAFLHKTRERRDLEYCALGKVLVAVIQFVVLVHLLGFLCLLIHSYVDHDTNLKLKTLQIRVLPHAIYLCISAFQNNGMTLTPDSVEPFSQKPFCLGVVGALILAGSTCFPICMRFVVAWKQRTARVGSQDWEAFTFLLEHPRRCFTHLFPPVHTMWLVLVVVALLLMQLLCIVQQNWDLPVFEHLSTTEKLLNSIFQAVSTRTAGLNCVDLPKLSAGTTFLFMVCMYISTSPTVVTMRFSAEQGGGDELDITGRPEGCEDEGGGAESVRGQAKRYLTQHATYLIMATFLVLCFERDQLYRSAEGPWHKDEFRMYGEFSTYKVIFEIISAYGTVGLTLGYPGSPASFSGAWSRESQFVLILVAILGRMRGLPDSIDPSVAFTMKLTGRSAAFMTATESDRRPKKRKGPTHSDIPFGPSLSESRCMC